MVIKCKKGRFPLASKNRRFIMRAFFLLLAFMSSLLVHSFSADSVAVSYSEKDADVYAVMISNLSSDTVYVLDCYLDKCSEGFYYESKYLHRYDKKTNICKLSFLPILGHIMSSVDGLIHFDFNKIVYGGMHYSFHAIPPHDCMQFELLKAAFMSDTFIKDYRDGKYCYIPMPIKKVKFYKRKPNCLKVEFAVYKNVDMLRKLNTDADFNLNEWHEDQFLYEVVDMDVPVPDCTRRYQNQRDWLP